MHPDSSESSVYFETFDVGHITIFAHCDHQEKDPFAEISIERSSGLTIASAVVGWIYFAAWSFSFYPQIIMNFRRKSVIGLNFDFMGLNLMGFSFYSIFNICLYFVPSFQQEYRERNPLSNIPVELNDVVFAVHAAIITLITILQCFMYQRGDQRLHRASILLISAALLVAFILLVLLLFDLFSKLNFIYYFSYVKLLITIIKYVPQAWFNFQRKSTIGWAIGNVLLDLTGGVFSILQMILLSINYDDWQSIFGNPTKFGLGAFSIMFDVLFIVQHYVLYRHAIEAPSTEALMTQSS